MLYHLFYATWDHRLLNECCIWEDLKWGLRSSTNYFSPLWLLLATSAVAPCWSWCSVKAPHGHCPVILYSLWTYYIINGIHLSIVSSYDVLLSVKRVGQRVLFLHVLCKYIDMTTRLFTLNITVALYLEHVRLKALDWATSMERSHEIKSK